MKCTNCGFFGSTFQSKCPYCQSKKLEHIEYTLISMYGYEFCISKDKVCVSKKGHSDLEDGWLTMSRHTFENFMKFYEEQKDKI